MSTRAESCGNGSRRELRFWESIAIMALNGVAIAA